MKRSSVKRPRLERPEVLPNNSMQRTALRAAGIRPPHAKRLRMLLSALDTAQSIDDVKVPGFRLHPQKGSERGRWSVWINGYWRLTFEFSEGHAYVLDCEDYH
jgi:proteic killer suppression protein